MKYLVAGCAGFIASKVVEQLLDAGHEVMGIDNMNDAYDVRLKQWRLGRLLRSNFIFRQIDITNIEELNFTNEFDAVINLAAWAGVRQSVVNPWIYQQVNCVGTLNLLEMCRRNGIKKFILASTSSLYGHIRMPFNEDDETNNPLSPYAASKKAAEVLAFTYHYLYGIDVSIPRYFTVYGPAGRPDMSIFRFIRRIAEGEPIVVFGDGSQSRDFTFVDDIARGTIAALTPVGYEIFNLGGDKPIELRAVIDEIAKLTGKSPIIEYRPAHKSDVLATWADISKADRILGWRPTISIEEGIRRSVEWYLNNREFARLIELNDRNE